MKKQPEIVLGFYIIHLCIALYQQEFIMPRKKIVNINQINGNNLTEKDHAFYIQHLEKGIRMIDSMGRRHSKVLQERMDLRYPKTIKSLQLFSILWRLIVDVGLCAKINPN